MTSRTQPAPPGRAVTMTAIASAAGWRPAGTTARPQISRAGTSLTSSPMIADLGELQVVARGEVADGCGLVLAAAVHVRDAELRGDLVQHGPPSPETKAKSSPARRPIETPMMSANDTLLTRARPRPARPCRP